MSGLGADRPQTRSYCRSHRPYTHVIPSRRAATATGATHQIMSGQQVPGRAREVVRREFAAPQPYMSGARAT